MKKKTIKTYWWVGKKNFGDIITPLLLKEYSIIPKKTGPIDADLYVVGSILTDLKTDCVGIFLGPGLIEDRWDYKFPNASIIGLRGEKTRQRIDAPKNVILGDPGILVDRLLLKRKRKEYIIGIVPHYVDKDDMALKKILSRNKKTINIIDIQKSPEKVLRDIDQCENILASSLHGLIAGHSLGIPSGWILLSNKVIGDGFKFYDYYSVFSDTIKPNKLNGNEDVDDLLKFVSRVPIEVDIVKRRLDEAFKFLYNLI